MNKQTDSWKYFLWPTYVVAFVLLVVPLIDALHSIWPLRPGILQWRFGSVGVVSGGIMTPLLAELLIFSVAVILGHRWLQIGLASINALVAVIVMCVIILFALDSVQQSAAVRPDAMLSFKIAVAKTFLRLILTALATGSLAFAGYKSFLASRPRGGKGKRKTRAAASLVRSPG
jgi:hypothetical protein